MNYIEQYKEDTEFSKAEESYLKSLGFKKKWLDDKSGSWFEKTFKVTKNRSIKIYVEYYNENLTIGFDHTPLDSDSGIDRKLKNIKELKAIDSKISKIVKLYKSI